ncbi:hypothetical protein DUNSADRAFT_7484 [Dunaliella salina]|uniref:Secreted protein n=1 Tax=Dunaliella salina TaxID=3046 RepID=A0ABQ7GLA8_DUNSA|nr:hypothetical protein DUNSADRAFT_7484 [Dunaliella salina]|eukprot:KAF5835399.1 hypothetical protein DUNSADRAFT_7484 [Dunaliella salina]
MRFLEYFLQMLVARAGRHTCMMFAVSRLHISLQAVSKMVAVPGTRTASPLALQLSPSSSRGSCFQACLANAGISYVSFSFPFQKNAGINILESSSSTYRAATVKLAMHAFHMESTKSSEQKYHTGSV